MGWLSWILFMPSLFPFPKQRSEAAKGTEWKMFLNLLNEELGFIPPHYHLPCFGFGFLVLNSRKTYTHTHRQTLLEGKTKKKTLHLTAPEFTFSVCIRLEFAFVLPRPGWKRNGKLPGKKGQHSGQAGRRDFNPTSRLFYQNEFLKPF